MINLTGKSCSFPTAVSVIAMLLLSGPALSQTYPGPPNSGQAVPPKQTESRQAPSIPSHPAAPAGFEAVTFPSQAADGATLTAYWRKPAGNTPTPVIVALHGCNGLFTLRGALTRREIDWSQRFVGLGYAVLLVDSFNPRGFRGVCKLKAHERTVRPFDRARDAAAAVAWLARNPAIDKRRIAMIGWSHGGSSVLWGIDSRLAHEGVEIRAAVAFYPGCRVPAESEKWAPRIPLTILMGDADDWTPPESCRTLAAKHPSIRLIEYAGAVHGFDAPNTPLTTLTGLGLTKDGTAKIGTDPKARSAAIAEVERLLVEAFK